MIRCFTSRRSRKHLRSSLLKKKISAAIGGTLSADCSRLFPPCYSFGCNGQEIEEKKIDEEEIRSSKIEGSEVREGCQAGSCGGSGTPTRRGHTRGTGRRLRGWGRSAAGRKRS